LNRKDKVKRSIHGGEEQQMRQRQGQDTRAGASASLKHSADERARRVEARIVARRADQVNCLTAQAAPPLRSVTPRGGLSCCLSFALCRLLSRASARALSRAFACAIACGVLCVGASAGVAGCHTPDPRVPLQDPAATGLEVGLAVAAEVLAEEGYPIKPNLAKGKARVETGWRAAPDQRRSVTVTLRDSPQGLIVATRLLTAIPVAQGQQATPDTAITFDGETWQLVRPPTEDDSAEQLRLAHQIQDRWKERMRSLPR
jgi:hypothetical protein